MNCLASHPQAFVNQQTHDTFEELVAEVRRHREEWTRQLRTQLSDMVDGGLTEDVRKVVGELKDPSTGLDKVDPSRVNGRKMLF